MPVDHNSRLCVLGVLGGETPEMGSVKTIRVTAASTSARWGELDANLANVIAAAARAAEDGARLLLLPECCLTGGDWPTGATSPRVEDVALELRAPVLAEVARVAKRTGLVIAPGFYERRSGRITISHALIGPRGLIGVYRKVHEHARSSREKDLFPVFDLGFARAGFSVCRDTMLPEHARILALRGAELMLAPFMSLPLTRRAWKLERLLPLRARAQDNRLFVLSASHAMPHVAGRPSEWGYSGLCCAVNPLGEVLGVSTGPVGRPQRLTVTLDESLLRTYLLGDVPSMYARRPRDYRDLASDAVQRRYLALAPPFAYREDANRTVAPARKSHRGTETQRKESSTKEHERTRTETD